MTTYDIESRLKALREIADEDFERAHIEEDNLYKDFILSIAMSGDAVWASKAARVLSAQEIEFSRYYA